MPHRRRDRIRAFTLLELLVVIALLSLISAVAMMQLGAGYRRAQHRRAIEVVGEIDRYARQLAQRKELALELRIDLADSKFKLVRPRDAKGTSQRSWRLARPIRVAGAATQRENRTTGEVVVRYDRLGRSDTYALAIASPSSEPEWLLIAGGTGQLTSDLSKRDARQAFDGLAQEWFNAD